VTGRPCCKSLCLDIIIIILLMCKIASEVDRQVCKGIQLWSWILLRVPSIGSAPRPSADHHYFYYVFSYYVLFLANKLMMMILTISPPAPVMHVGRSINKLHKNFKTIYGALSRLFFNFKKSRKKATSLFDIFRYSTV